MSTEKTIRERQSVHGEFTDNARIADNLITILSQEPGWLRLNPIKRIALTYIMGKVSRIIAGDHNFKDHWHDIGGYAKCVEDKLQPEKLIGALGQVRPSKPCPQCNQLIPLTVPSGKCPLCGSQLV